MKILILSSAESPHTIKWVNTLSEDQKLSIILVSRHKLRSKISDKVKFYQLRQKSKLSYLTSIFEFNSIIKKENPDIIHAHYASGYGTLAMLSRHDYILSVWGSDIYDFPSNTIKKLIIKTNLKMAKKIYSTSHTMAKEIAKYTKKQIKVIPFGVDTRIFNKNSNHEYSKTNDSIHIGIVKVIDYKYGIDTLIQGFSIYNNRFNSNSKLTIIGNGPQLQEMKDLASSLKVNEKINFVGWVDNKELPNFLNEFDIFVLTSRLDSESFGVAAVEASACYLPCIVTNVGGLTEVVKDGITGIVIPKDDPLSLAEKISFLVDNPGVRKKMGDQGRQNVEQNYNWTINVESMKNEYRIIMEHK